MPANVKELILIATNPAPGGSGTVVNTYRYATNDTATVVETDGHFDGILENGLNVGDFIFASMDLDGTPAGKTYMVTVGGADVTVAAL